MKRLLLVWLCNPNNPTGTYFNHDELESFLERVPSHVPVLIDEAYFEFDRRLSRYIEIARTIR